MRISAQGMAFIRQFEGFSARLYRDVAGLWTIGYGHLVTSGEQFLGPLSPEEAVRLLRKDVAVAEGAVGRLIRVPLRQAQFDALVSFTFNLGGGVLQRSTLRSVLNRGEYEAVPGQLMRYVFAGGRTCVGLVRRRGAEAALFSN